MNNPWLVLNLPPDADDAAIRQAWRAALQIATPERDPLRFQAVQEAYTAIRDARSRGLYAVQDLKNPPDGPAAAARALLPLPGYVQVPDPSLFLSYLKSCVSPP